jgi:short-subunit dehydrogenase
VGAAAEVAVADLTQPAELRAVEERVAADPALEVLVNNAGFAAYMPFVRLDPDRAEELIRLHVVALTRLTRAALPGMIARGRGTIVNVSSLLAFSASIGDRPLPARATYAATKSYINTFTEILHHELRGTGVRVQVLCPGIVDTEFHGPDFDPSRAPYPPLMPDAVVEAALAGLRLGEVICVPALGDPALVTQNQESQRRLLQASVGGSIAERYRVAGQSAG